MSNRPILLRGSERRQPLGTRRLAKKPSADESIQVTVVLRPASGPDGKLKAVRDIASQTLKKRNHLSRAQFLNRHGARHADILKVLRFAREHGLRVIQSSREKRCVILSGTLGSFEDALSVEFTNNKLLGEAFRSFDGGIRIPPFLDGVVEEVLGLENRVMMNHHTFSRARESAPKMRPRQVAEAYNFPPKATGKGQCIAIIELGGGFYPDDIKNYFSANGLEVPEIKVIEIDGQKNNPSPQDALKKMLDAMGASTAAQQQTGLDPTEARQALWTIETTFDVELIGSFANGARLVVYFAPNNAQGKYRALTEALHNKKFPPDLISCSWGAVEDDLPSEVTQSLDGVFQDAILRGVTICYSSGDRGEDPDKNGQPRVHFPASSPHVLSCGGTHWVEPTTLDEVVWSETLPTAVAQSGGGVSKVFEEPEWQHGAGVESKTGKKGRGVPDVAGKADMATGYSMLVGGHSATMGGTSAAAPLWTGLIARLNEELKQNVGYAPPLLYRPDFESSFHDVIKGNNGKNYKAEPGWDACTGLGTPDGMSLLNAFKADPKKKR